MKQLAVTTLHSFVAQQEASTPVLLLDVREPWETAMGTITLPGAHTRLLPMNSLPDHLDELDREQPIVCICHHGMRSAQVVAFLSRQGFEAVYNLAGGTDAWSAQVDPQLPRY
jgi:rhodanese-related sulfurtransferase